MKDTDAKKKSIDITNPQGAMALAKEILMSEQKSNVRPKIKDMGDRKLRYQIRVTIAGNPYYGGFKTLGEAERFADYIEKLRKEAPRFRQKALRVKRADGKGYTYESLQTIQGLMEAWAERAPKDLGIRESSISVYMKIYGPNMKPTFGDKMLHQITEEDLTDLLYEKRHLSKTTLNIVVVILKHLNKYARKKLGYPADKLLQFDLDDIRIQSDQETKPHEHIEKETLKEIIRLMFEIANAPKKRGRKLSFYCPYAIVLMASTGLRSGEARALKWEDIDFMKKELKVSRTVTLDSSGNEIMGNKPKSKSSNRAVSLSESMLLLIKDYRKVCEERGMTTEPGDLIFRTSDGKFVQASPFRKTKDSYLKRIKETYKIDTHFTHHQLRATFATYGIREAEDPAGAISDMQRMLGHSTANMTLHYAKALGEGQKQIVNALPFADTGKKTKKTKK